LKGVGLVEGKAQNLIANGTNVNKIWTIANLAALGANADGAKPFSTWMYIKDATTLAKFKSSGTAVEIKIGSDASNYYSKTWTVADLAVGWNFLTSGTTNLNALTATGTPGSPLDTFIITIITNNATDTFVAGDVVYDLLRQWATTDLIKSFTTGYPSIDYTNLETTTRTYLLSTEANGFLIDSIGIFNEDTSPLMFSEDTFTSESKSSTDEFAFIIKDRVV